ncbi:MAG: DNA-methyltransferase [Candidatus Helarchaeota archaeon]
MDKLEINGHIIYYKSSEDMSEIPDNSIQLIITSPPYGSIKDYGVIDQIGYEEGFLIYLERLNKVWNECYRILEPTCRMVINIGDQYLRTTEHGRYRIFSIQSAIIEHCIKQGFDFLGDIIWQKISTTHTTGGCSLMGSIYYPRNGLVTFDYEHILIFKKWKGKKRSIDLEKKELSKICMDEWKSWFVGHWKFPGIQQKGHLAMFPDELPYRIIRMFSHVGDIVLDPFLGSGTTIRMAEFLKRRGIGYEINPNFKNIQIEKIKSVKEERRKDFHTIISYFYTNQKKINCRFDFDKQKRKEYIVLKLDNYDKYVIIDLMIINISSVNSLSGQIENKLKSNGVQNFLNQENNKNDLIDKYIIIISEKNKELVKIIRNTNKKYHYKIIFEFWEDVIGNFRYFDELYKSKIENYL